MLREYESEKCYVKVKDEYESEKCYVKMRVKKVFQKNENHNY